MKHKSSSKYNYKNIPRTEYQDDLKELSVSIPEMWLESFTRTTIPNVIGGSDIIELLGKEIFDKFINWQSENNMNYQTNPIKLGMKLKTLNTDGLSKGRDKENGKTKAFDMIKLRKYFNIARI